MKIQLCRTIMVLEDDPNDVFFLQRAFHESGFAGKLIVFDDGQKGMDYICGLGACADRARHPLPDLLITDLKMPRVTGLEVLRWLKQHPDFAVIPVIVLTASDLNTDIREACRLGANAYLTKPADPAVRLDMVRKLIDFWAYCRRAEIPKPVMRP
jgi:CheY-like chemotaxis protein